jgi:hypothetical protein
MALGFASQRFELCMRMLVMIRWFITDKSRTINAEWQSGVDKFSLDQDLIGRSGRRCGMFAGIEGYPRWTCTRRAGLIGRTSVR